MSLKVSLTIGVASVVAASSSSHDHQFHTSCPCIAQQENASDVVKNEFLQLGVDLEENWNYGIGCDSHDNITLRCRSDSKPAYCSDSWCYVSAHCQLNVEADKHWPGRWFSYAPCGYLDRFLTSMKGDALKVVMLTNSGGWKGVYCGEDQESQCTGPTWELLDSTLSRAGAEIDEVARFDGSEKEQSGKSIDKIYPPEVLQALYRDRPNERGGYWACWYAAGMGFVDMCMSASSVSPARVRIAKTVNLFSEPVYLVTTRVEVHAGLDTYLKSAFRPFHWQLWLGIFCFTLLAGWILAWQEHRHAGEYVGVPAGSVLVDATYRGLRSFVDGGCEFEPEHLGGRFTAIGLGFFLLITITSYTANLAFALIEKDESTLVVTSWQNLLDNPSWKLCFDDGYADWLKTPPFNLPAAQRVVYTQRAEVMENIGTVCEAAAVGLEDLQAFQAVDRRGCNIARVGDPLFDVERVVAVSDRVFDMVRYHVQSVTGGPWQSMLRRWALDDVCTDDDSGQGQKKGTHPGMQIEEMAGPFIIASTFCILGVITTCVSTKSRLCTSSEADEVLKGDQGNYSSGTQDIQDELSQHMKQHDLKIDQVLTMLQTMNGQAVQVTDVILNLLKTGNGLTDVMRNIQNDSARPEVVHAGGIDDSSFLRHPGQSVQSSTEAQASTAQGVSDAEDFAQSACSNYAIGVSVEVFSHSFTTWCPGKVMGVENSDGQMLVIVEFTWPTGETATKKLPVEHQDLRIKE